MKIHHIGYAVKKIDKAIISFENLGYLFGEIIDDYDRNIRLSFGCKDGYRIELVQPLDKTKESPVDAYLSKVGPTPYHICYESDDFENEVALLKQQGFRELIPPTRAVAFGGKNVIFMMNLGMGLMEIIDN